jgi:hypothetical protein
LQREKLIAGLRRLQRAGRALALADQRRHLRAVAVDIADDAGLHAHGVLQAADGVLPARARIGDELASTPTSRRCILLLERRSIFWTSKAMFCAWLRSCWVRWTFC